MASNMLNQQPKRKSQNALFSQSVITKENEEINEKVETIKQEEQKTETIQPEQSIPVTPEPKQEEKQDTIDISKEESKQEPPQLPKQKEDKKESEVVVVDVKEYTAKEKEYLQRIEDIRDLINNPTPINRMNKRRRYSEDRRRNVTFSIREDLSYLIDDLVDDAKIYKGLFQDEVILLGIQTYIEKYGIK